MLRRHDAGPVTVLYEETPERPSQSREAVVEHGRRVVALADRVAVLPMRYGTTVADLDELRTVAEQHADAWGRRLAQLSGRCELVVHVDVRASPEMTPESGRAYLRRRMEHVQRHDRALNDARALLADRCDEMRVLPDGHRLAVLVARRDAQIVRAAVATWGQLHDDLEVNVTGPWPPFSFCEEAELS